MSRRGLLLLLAGASLSAGCGRKQENDADARLAWVADQTAKNKWWLRSFLIGSKDVQFFDGWFPMEFDPKTGGAWRWAEKRSVVRLRTHIEGREPSDMKLTLHGWVAYQFVGSHTAFMELTLNGHVIDRWEPPREPFIHPVDVPRWLLGDGEWVDLVINVTNGGVPWGDWRELAYSTTGIIWKRADEP